MIHSIEKLKGFGFGLFVAGVAVISSGTTRAAQGLCAGTCQSCCACGFTAVPVILWMAIKVRRRITKLKFLNGKLQPRLTPDSFTQVL